MAHRFILPASLILLLGGLTAGCASLKPSEAEQARAKAVVDTQTLVNYLDYKNIALMNNGRFTAPDVSTPGYEFTVMSGGSLFVFEYASGGDALNDVASLERERSITAERHMYRKENLVAVYYGDDPRVQRALALSMGSRTN